jgi:hypothetical protein
MLMIIIHLVSAGVCRQHHCVSANTQSSAGEELKKSFLEGVDQRRRGRKTKNYLAFKRPAPAVWGNGLWGSVGGAGRSYD